MPRATGTVLRAIRFYRANLGPEPSGRPRALPVAGILQQIRALSFPSGDNYLAFPDGNFTCCWIDGTARGSNRLRFGISRRSGLPEIEDNGRVTPLRIAASAGVLEPIHVIFFPNNIVGADFNFYGPRLARLAFYICKKTLGLCDRLEFEPLLRGNVLDQIQRLQDIRLFKIRIRSSFADDLRRADQDLFGGIAATRDVAEADEIEIMWRPRPRSRGRLSNRVLVAARRLAERSNLNEQAEKFEIKGYDPSTGEVELIDVLADQFVSRKSITLQNTRTRALAGC